jgi:serine/threonine-protein kinase
MHDNVMNAAMLEPGTVVAGWRLLERVGLGGYGAVYRAESVEHPGTFCAIKVALYVGDARAGREAALLLDKAVHPNVVRCHGVGHWPHPTHGRPFIIMEYVQGLPLHRWVEHHNPDFARLAYVGAEAALALGSLHARGVLHRDLKPEHLLVREPDLRPVLVDFGAGDYAGAGTLTETPLPPGTAHLRSPEAACFWLAHGQEPRARYTYGPADELYALGVCLYRALTGHYPFPDTTDLKPALYLDIANRVPAAPSDVNPRVPRALSDIVMRLLAKKPEERYRNGEEVHAALLAAVTFGAAEPWEARVFDWEDGPDGDAAGGVSSTSRRRIRRPAPPAQPPASKSPPSWEPPGRGKKSVVLGLAIGAALLMVAVLLVLLLGRTGEDVPAGAPTHLTPQVAQPHPPAAVQEVAPEAQVPHTAPAAAPQLPADLTPAATAQSVRPEDSVPMKKRPQQKRQPSQKPPPTTANTPDAWKAALLFCLMKGGGAACAGAPLRPVPETCPPEALAAMKMLRIDIEDGAEAWIDLSKPRSDWSLTTYQDGPVVSSFVERFGDIPEGSVLFGRLYVSGNGVDEFGSKKVYGRWDKVKLTDGRELPVCFRLGNRDGLYESTGDGAPLPPGYARFPHNMPLVAVDRFVYE